MDGLGMAPAQPTAPGPPSSTEHNGSGWTPPAQRAVALFGVIGLVLVAWYGWDRSRWSTRPLSLDRGPDFAYRIDINRAGHAELLQLPGIGRELAARIEEHRRDYGPFRSVDDLSGVPGIGPLTVERIRPWVEAGAPAAPPSSVRQSFYAGPSPTPPPPKPAGKKEQALTGLIDVNRASPAELQKLPAIGPVLSQRIVEERERGPYRTVDELRRVRGIGAKTLERLRPHVTVGIMPENAP